MSRLMLSNRPMAVFRPSSAAPCRPRSKCQPLVAPESLYGRTGASLQEQAEDGSSALMAMMLAIIADAANCHPERRRTPVMPRQAFVAADLRSCRPSGLPGASTCRRVAGLRTCSYTAEAVHVTPSEV